MSNSWFDVDKEGLAKLLKRKGMAYVLYELIQNGWDTATSFVEVTLTPVEGRPLVEIDVIDDDPDGFKTFSHAFTLFAESEKKGDPTKRGRFNLGEKLVLAACESASITSTKGTIRFDREGRHSSPKKRERGTHFQAVVRMTRDELAEVLEATKLLLPPIVAGVVVRTVVNGETLPTRVPTRTISLTLPTDLADEDGYLKRTTRKADVEIHPKRDGEVARLYEMGIPVVDLPEDPWSINVLQKVPLNSERDNVTPAYLRELRVGVLNAMFDQLKPEQAKSLAVQEAIKDERVKAEAMDTVLTHQYGKLRAISDPSDPQAGYDLIAKGYTLIPGGAYSKGQWENIRRTGAAIPAGTLAPSPKPYSSDPNAPSRVLVPESEWTKGMQNIAYYASDLGWKLIKRSVRITIDKGQFGQGWGACYGDGELTFNLTTLGRAFFDEGPSERVNALLLHEFSHEYESNHLSDGFYKALQKLGAKMVALALKEPAFFQKYGA